MSATARPKTAEPDAEWLTPSQAAHYLQVGPTTIYMMYARQGSLPVSKAGRLVRIRRADLDSYMEKYRKA